MASRLPPEARLALLEGARPLRAAAGHWITDETRRANLLGPGDGFGEEALLLEASRTATVRTLSPGRLLVLGRADFDALSTSCRTPGTMSPPRRRPPIAKRACSVTLDTRDFAGMARTGDPEIRAP